MNDTSRNGSDRSSCGSPVRDAAAGHRRLLRQAGLERAFSRFEREGIERAGYRQRTMLRYSSISARWFSGTTMVVNGVSIIDGPRTTLPAPSLRVIVDRGIPVAGVLAGEIGAPRALVGLPAVAAGESAPCAAKACGACRWRRRLIAMTSIPASACAGAAAVHLLVSLVEHRFDGGCGRRR